MLDLNHPLKYPLWGFARLLNMYTGDDSLFVLDVYLYINIYLNMDVQVSNEVLTKGFIAVVISTL